MGEKAYKIMQRIKEAFDPGCILNPGVMICANPSVHVENLNPLPSTNDIVDKCIECGFCEPKCTSRNITTTLRLRATGEDPARLNRLGLRYQGKQTCVVDGLCAMACPGSINTGDLTKYLRNVQLHQDATCGEVQSRCSVVRGKSRRAVKSGLLRFYRGSRVYVSRVERIRPCALEVVAPRPHAVGLFELPHVRYRAVTAQRHFLSIARIPGGQVHDEKNTNAAV